MTDHLTKEKHLTPDELEWVIDRLGVIVAEYGFLGVEEGIAEMNRRVVEEDVWYVK